MVDRKVVKLVDRSEQRMAEQRAELLVETMVKKLVETMAGWSAGKMVVPTVPPKAGLTAGM